MKQVVKKKKITIETAGPLRIKGGIRGPIEIPYMEEISVIGRMITSGYKVIEHLSDGRKVQLTVQNYNKENGVGDLRCVLENVKSAKTIIKKNEIRPDKSEKVIPIIDIYQPK